MIRLHPELSPATIATDLKAQGWVQIRQFLSEPCADQLSGELRAESRWDLAITAADGPIALSAEELQQLSPARKASLAESLRRQARSGFSFSYLRRDVLPASEPFCQAWASWLQSPQCMQLWRELTGNGALVRADAHACLYQPGHFLRTHDDTYSGKKRRFAYVMNFTRDWQPDWGGQLNMLTDGESTRVLAPHFNSLCLFQVPRDHFVSQVASFARAGRYSITGWLFE